MRNVIPFQRKTKDYLDDLSDAEVAQLAMRSVPVDPQITDLIGPDASAGDYWLALLVEDLIRTDRESLVLA